MEIQHLAGRWQVALPRQRDNKGGDSRYERKGRLLDLVRSEGEPAQFRELTDGERHLRQTIVLQIEMNLQRVRWERRGRGERECTNVRRR